MKRLIVIALLLACFVGLQGCLNDEFYIFDQNVSNYDMNSAVTGVFAGAGIDLNDSIGNILVGLGSEVVVDGNSIWRLDIPADWNALFLNTGSSDGNCEAGNCSLVVYDGNLIWRLAFDADFNALYLNTGASGDDTNVWTVGYLDDFNAVTVDGNFLQDLYGAGDFNFYDLGSGNSCAYDISNGSFTCGGESTIASGAKSVAFGQWNKATGAYSGALWGFGNTASATSAMAGGNNSQATQNYAIAMGNYATASGEGAVAIGVSVKALANFSSAIGYGVINGQSYVVALGRDVNVARDLLVKRDLNVEGKLLVKQAAYIDGKLYVDDIWDNGQGHIDIGTSVYIDNLWVNNTTTLQDVNSTSVQSDNFYGVFHGDGRDLNGVVVDLNSNDINVEHFSAATYQTVQHFVNTQSAGKISGGELTDSGSSSVNVAAGIGMVKTSNSSVGTLKFVEWDASAGVAVDDNTFSYIYINYNTGTGAVTVAVTDSLENLNLHTQFPIGLVYRRGTTVEVLNDGVDITDYTANDWHKLAHRGIERMTGGLVAESGTRYLTVTAGVYYKITTHVETDEIDTTGADTFTPVYRDGSGSWTYDTGISQFSNILYDDGDGVLGNIGVAKYATYYVYECLEGDIYVQYGQGAANNLVTAQQEAIPTPPDYLSRWASLRAKIIILRGATNASSVNNYVADAFTSYAASVHNELSGLQGGKVAEYYHLTSTAYGFLGKQDQNVQVGSSPDFNGANITNVSIDDYIPSEADIDNNSLKQFFAYFQTVFDQNYFNRFSIDWDLNFQASDTNTSQDANRNNLGLSNLYATKLYGDGSGLTGITDTTGTHFTQAEWDGNFQASDKNVLEDLNRNNLGFSNAYGANAYLTGNLNVTGTITTADDVIVNADNKGLVLGAGQDSDLYFNGSDTVFDNTGTFYVINSDVNPMIVKGENDGGNIGVQIVNKSPASTANTATLSLFCSTSTMSRGAGLMKAGFVDIVDATKSSYIQFQNYVAGDLVTSLKIDDTGYIGVNQGTPIARFDTTGTAFTTAWNSWTGIAVNSADCEGGDGNYGTPIEFNSIGTTARKRAAIVPIQGGVDSDLLGLGIFVSPNTSNSAPVELGLHIAYDGGIHTPLMKTGTTQGGAGAAAGELWADTDAGNVVKWGT